MRRMVIVVVLLALAASAAGCGATGGQGAASEPSTTSGSGGGAATTSTSPDGGRRDLPTVEQMEAALPTPAEVGPGYDLTDDDGMPGGTQQDPRVTAQCPAVADMGLMKTQSMPHASHSYGIDGTSTIGVGLAHVPPTVTADTVDRIIGAYRSCPSITVTDVHYGTVTYELEARPAEYGDLGLTFRSSVTYTEAGRRVHLEGQGAMFVVGDIAVAILVRSDLRPDGTTAPIDASRLDPLARLMEDRAGAL